MAAADHLIMLWCIGVLLVAAFCVAIVVWERQWQDAPAALEPCAGLISLHGPGVPGGLVLELLCPHQPAVLVNSAVTGWPLALLCAECGTASPAPGAWLAAALSGEQPWQVGRG